MDKESNEQNNVMNKIETGMETWDRLSNLRGKRVNGW